MYRKNAWEQYSAEERARLSAFSDAYRVFLDNAKTEREAAAEAERICRAAGFRNLDTLIKTGELLGPGERVYRKWMNKSFMAFVVPGHPLLRRYQEVPMAGPSPGAAWRDREAGRRHRRGVHRRGGR